MVMGAVEDVTAQAATAVKAAVAHFLTSASEFAVWSWPPLQSRGKGREALTGTHARTLGKYCPRSPTNRGPPHRGDCSGTGHPRDLPFSSAAGRGHGGRLSCGRGPSR